jgi:hypothetical protein
MRSASLLLGRSSLNRRCLGWRTSWWVAGRLYFATTATFLLLIHSLAAEPLKAPDVPDLYQRVITLPGAVLASQPLAQGGEKTRVFDIFYVFERKLVGGREWLGVGKRVDGPVAGWMPAEHTQNWSMMLTMQYTPPGGRESRVLFFENREDLAALVTGDEPAPLVEQLTAAADAGNQIKPRVVAIEPREEDGTVDYRSHPYLIPISDFQRATFAGGHPTATLLRIASLTADATPEATSPASANALKIGIVFVVDTTISMQPYIDRVVQTIKDIHSELEQTGLQDRVSFGLIGYRNNDPNSPHYNPEVGYHTHIYQPLDPQAPFESLLNNIEDMQEAKAPTPCFDEDALAGLKEAVHLNWEPFAARWIVLVTDAGPLQGSCWVSDPSLRTVNIHRQASDEHISIFALHLISQEARTSNRVDYAAAEYKILSSTGDENKPTYFSINADTPEHFRKDTQEFADCLVRQVRDPEDRGCGLSGNGEGSGPPNIGELVTNELFNARMRYIGKTRGTAAPVFFHAWASDKDLVSPTAKALTVSVFLTRNQLSDLALALEKILDDAKAQQVSAASFFDLVRSLAASTSFDPGRFGARFATIAESNLLPAYLKYLPYKSRFLTMSRERWNSQGRAGQEQDIDRLQSLLNEYRKIEQDNDKWIDLADGAEGGWSGRNRGEEVYPLRLGLLP